MTYARKKAAAPATAAKPNDAWRPDAAPVNGVPDGLTGAPVAAGLVTFWAGAMEPVPLATGPGAPPAALETVGAATVTVL